MNWSYKFTITLVFHIILLSTCNASKSLTDIAGVRYWGTQVQNYPGKNFNYLDTQQGSITAIFYGSFQFTAVDSVDIYILDPKYYDQKIILVQIKDIVNIDSDTPIWTNDNHSVTVVEYWREVEQDSYSLDGVSSKIVFGNTQTEDALDLVLSIQMVGDTFGFKGDLSYQSKLVQTILYNLYIAVLVGIQLICGGLLIKKIQNNQAQLSKLSILTIGLCCLLDFSSALRFIQLIMTISGNFLIYTIPSISYIMLFVTCDMKLLFLVWRSQHLREVDNPVAMRKKLTIFYIIFYVGLFIFLVMQYFFSNYSWFIILSYAILVPQIVHNVRLGMKPSFEITFIFGYIASRILLPIYERGCPENLFRKRQELFAIVVFLIGLYAVKIMLLLVQFYWGSRFFVPKRFLPNYYEYKRKLKANEDNKDEECTICLQSIFSLYNQGSIKTDGSIEDHLMEQVEIMITPCGHKFHEECLCEWMEVKMECPTCRAVLPLQ